MPTKRIVVVDDDPKVRELIEWTLRPPEFQVLGFGDPRDALAKLAGLQPHLIICDMMMPDMDGRVFLKVVKRSEALKDVPFLFLTAVRVGAEVQAAFDAGAAAFLVKPFPVARLVRTIRDVLESSQPAPVAAPSPVRAVAKTTRAAPAPPEGRAPVERLDLDALQEPTDDDFTQMVAVSPKPAYQPPPAAVSEAQVAPAAPPPQPTSELNLAALSEISSAPATRPPKLAFEPLPAAVSEAQVAPAAPPPTLAFEPPPAAVSEAQVAPATRPHEPASEPPPAAMSEAQVAPAARPRKRAFVPPPAGASQTQVAPTAPPREPASEPSAPAASEAQAESAAPPLERPPVMIEGRFSTVQLDDIRVQVMTEAESRPNFIITTVVSRDGQGIRRIETAWSHPLKRREDLDLVRRHIDLQHERALDEIRRGPLQGPRRRTIWERKTEG